MSVCKHFFLFQRYFRVHYLRHLNLITLPKYSTSIKARFSRKQNYKDFEFEDKISTSKWRTPCLRKKNWRTLQYFLAKEWAYLQFEESSEIILPKEFSVSVTSKGDRQCGGKIEGSRFRSSSKCNRKRTTFHGDCGESEKLFYRNR